MNASFYYKGLIIIGFLCVYILLEYLPQIAGSTYSSIEQFFDRHSDYSTASNWQTVDANLKLRSKKLDYDIDAIGLDIPEKNNSSNIISVLNTLMKTYRIKSYDIEYLNYTIDGEYSIRPIKFTYHAHYRDGIRFLNALETHKKLMRVKEIAIENKKNTKNQPVEFELLFEQIIKGKLNVN